MLYALITTFFYESNKVIMAMIFGSLVIQFSSPILIFLREMKSRRGPLADQKRDGLTFAVPWLMNIPKWATISGTIAQEVKGVLPS